VPIVIRNELALAMDEELRVLLARLMGSEIGSRTWERALDKVAAKRCEAVLLAAIEERLEAFKRDVAGWRP
jgi:hypothetical protein